MPAPTDRTAITKKMSQRSSTPESMNRARPRVERAIAESEAIIINRRFTRSAQTPAKIETIACGTKPKITARASTKPDLVVRVRCQRIAYCTKKEPNIEMVCPVRKIAMRFFQPGMFSLVWVSEAAPAEFTCDSIELFLW